MLDLLPIELLIMIAEKLPNKSLRLFSQTSAKVRTILASLVYRRITFSAANEWALNVLDIDTYFQHHQAARPDCYLEHTKELSFSAPISIARFNRCTCYNIFRMVQPLRTSLSLGTSNDTTAHLQFLSDISEQVNKSLRWLKPHALRSFHWHLGCCLPAGILDENGLLTLQQKSLQSISLITDASCPHGGQNVEGLSSFHFLQRLEWEGIQHPMEVDSLKKCIWQNRKRLTHLSVKFTASANVQELRWERLQTVTEGTQGKGSLPEIHLPSIFSISLSRVTFSPIVYPNISPVHSSLRELTLRHCPNQLGFLFSLSKSKEAPRLKRFEICCDMLTYGSQGTNEKSWLWDFLVSFEGLQSLRLRLSNFKSAPAQIEEVIRRHRGTLTDFVYHETCLMSIDQHGLYEENRDITPSWLPNFCEIIGSSQFKELALCASLRTLRGYLEPVATRSSLRVLHVRLSGSQYNHRNLRREFYTRHEEIRDQSSRDFHGIHQVDPMCLYDRIKHPNLATLDLIGNEFSPIPEVSQAEPSGYLFEVDDLLNFANWAFSSTGLQGLKFLAIGDFSHQDQYQQQRFILERDTSQVSTDIYRLLSEDELPDRVLDFLSSCPGDQTMESLYT